MYNQSVECFVIFLLCSDEFKKVDIVTSVVQCVPLPSPDLSVDAMDVSGESQIDIDHHMFKQRLDLDGNPINEAPVKEDVGSDTDDKAANVRIIHMKLC